MSQHKGRIEGPITHIDVNSMYPAVMYYDQYPMACLMRRQEPGEGKLYVIRCRIKLKLSRKSAYIYVQRCVDCMLEGLKSSDPVIETKEFHDLYLLISITITLRGFTT